MSVPEALIKHGGGFVLGTAGNVIGGSAGGAVGSVFPGPATVAGALVGGYLLGKGGEKAATNIAQAYRGLERGNYPFQRDLMKLGNPRAMMPQMPGRPAFRPGY